MEMSGAMNQATNTLDGSTTPAAGAGVSLSNQAGPRNLQ